MNADCSWDFRAVCEICKASLARTCKPAGLRVKPGSRSYGQGRPLGKCFAWAKQADMLGPAHTAELHRAYIPDFEARRAARLEAMAMEGADLWIAKERAIDAVADGADGEPYDLP